MLLDLSFVGIVEITTIIDYQTLSDELLFFGRPRSLEIPPNGICLGQTGSRFQQKTRQGVSSSFLTFQGHNRRFEGVMHRKASRVNAVGE